MQLVSGGTDNHLVLIDVHPFGLTGRQAEQALLDCGIVTNRNAIPQDPNGAWYTSGIRIGTPALTTPRPRRRRDGPDRRADPHRADARPTPAEGSKAKYDLDPAVADRVSKQATELLADFPLYPTVDLG